MIYSKDDAILAGRKYLTELGIKTFDVVSAARQSGKIRATYLPNLDQDYWMVTFDRSTKLIFDTSDIDATELELLSIAAEENSRITVNVELDGSVEVI